jgi:hypothetical protein
LDYRFHYAQLVAEDRLRQQRPTQATKPTMRVHYREASRQVPATARR